MTAALRTLAFGDLVPDGVWGGAWTTDAGNTALTALGAGVRWGALADSRLSATDDAEAWHLAAPGGELVAEPAGEPVDVQTPDGGIAGWDQMCQVTGRFVRDGSEHRVDCLGVRSWWSGSLEPYESIRAVSVWFEAGEAMAVTAFRPRKTKGHDRDVVAAAVIAQDLAAAVEDPRLSTTYEADGWPVRAGLELWLAGEEPERQYPRRASGEAAGARAEATAGGLELRAEPFRWRSRGRDGAGMYLVARRR